MTRACDRTDSNTLAELRNDSGEINYRDDAATYFDDIDFRKSLLLEVGFRFNADNMPFDAAIETALLNILEHYIQYETLPDWIKPLVDKVAKERFGDE